MRKTILAWVALAGAVPAFAQTVMDFTGDWDLNSSVSGHVTEIITQTKVRHLPVVFAGDRDEAAARVRAKPFMEVGHPVYIMDSCREEDILALARKLKGRYDLKPKLEVTGPACFPAAAVYRKYRSEELFTWVHAVDAPDGFTSEDLTYEPTPMRASKAFARRFVRPASIAKNAAGNWLVDFGRAAFGWVEARTPSAVRAVAGEKLTDAKSVDVIPFSAIRSATACAAATDGADFKRLVFKTEIYSRGRCLSIPRELGEVMPMRYLEVPAGSFEPTAENVRMVALEYPFDEGESGFVSDNRLLDDVYGLCKYTLRACTFGGLYIDGDRERLPYEADAWVTQLSNHAMSSDYEVSRVTCDYLMPYPTWPTEYRQISVLLNWTYWMWSGRDDLLRKHYAQLKDEKLMERFRRESDGLLETGGEMFHGAYEGAADIADWPPPERFGFEFRKANAVVNAYYYIGLNEMAEIATQIGKTEDADAFRARARRVYDSFQKAFFDAKRGIYVDGEGATHASIHANAIAVVAGLVPEKSLKGVGDWLAAREMECSVYFAQHFLEALFRTGHGARAVALMTADNDRSWVGMLKAGATLTKESWNEGVKANIDWNHTWGTAAINVIARCLAGVTPATPGFGKIRIAPDPAGLGSFDAKVPTAKGPVSVRYARTGDGERLIVTTPAPATVVFRGKTREVAAGTHEFAAPLAVTVFPQSFRGGWGMDVSSTEVLGSPYLIAHGMGRPVPDAQAEVSFPETGAWRVWVRTRNWADGAPGTFRVVVDGVELPHVFGAGSDKWTWERGDLVDVAKSSVRVALRDLTGFDGRCAGVVFARDSEPAPVGALDVRTAEPSETFDADFVIVGGGMPGCAAAVAAARAGLTVALVQDRPVLGGNASSEIRVWCGGESRHPLVDELRGLFMNRDGDAAACEQARLAKLQREKGLGVFLSHRAFAVEKDGAGIAAVKAVDLGRNRVVRFRGKLFCDGTGDGWIGYWAGADYRYGRESRDETGEKSAVEKADAMVMGASLMWNTSYANDDVPFAAPWAERFAEGGPAVNGEWFWEYGHWRDMLTEDEAIRDRLLLAIYGAFSLAKKDPKNARRMLTTCPYVLGKRESRRLLGDWVLKEEDVAAQRPFEDAVATATWSMDVHYPHKTVPYMATNEHPQRGRIWIPYRAIYSRNVPNLFMVGRCLSCTHLALGAVRVMNTLSQLGVAAGIAAAMCREKGCQPRDLFAQGCVRDLQRRIGGDWPGNPDPAKKDWIIVDDEDKDVRFEGSWTAHIHENGGQVGDWAHMSDGKAGDRATYPLARVPAGRYRLYGRVPYSWAPHDCDGIVSVSVRSAAGAFDFKWNEHVGMGRWNVLGEVVVGADAALTAQIPAGSRELVLDGFAFEPVPLRVALTFDDAVKDHLLIAAPELEKRGWRGVFNVVTDWVGKDDGRLSWADVSELIRRGHEVTTHGKTHCNLVATLRDRGPEAVRRELAESRDAIADRTGFAPRYFCAPYMQQNGEIARLCRLENLALMDVRRHNFGSNNADRVTAVIGDAIACGESRLDILHHGISAEDHGGWCPFVSRASFTAHLDAIKRLEDAGRIVVTDYDGVRSSCALRAKDWPRHGVVTLSFDDHNLADWERAFPLFAKYGTTVTFFTTGEIGSNEVAFARKALVAGHEFALHGAHHANADDALAKLGADGYWAKEMEPQVTACRMAGIPVRSFAYPNCRHNAETDELFFRHGFTRVRGSIAGVKSPNPHDPKGLKLDQWKPVATYDPLYAPATALLTERNIANVIMGASYHTDIEDILAAMARCGERAELLSIVSHGIAPEPNGISMRTEWLERMLSSAAHLGVVVRGVR